MKQSVFYLKKLTSAEVGTTKAHVGGYIRLPNDFDYKLFFQSQGTDNNGVIEIFFNAFNLNKGIIEENLRFAYFENSNKERRIPNLATLYKDNDVEEGDVVKLESSINNGMAQIFIKFFKNSDLKTSASNIFYVSNEESDLDFNESQTYNSLQQIYYGAPGTGKSHSIKKNTEVAEKEKRVIRTTFHPDSDYSTFVGAYKPSMDKEKKHARMNLSLEDLSKELSGYYNDNKLGKIGGVQKFCLDYHEFIDGEIMSVNVNKLLELAGIPEAYNVEVNKYVKFCQLLPKQDKGKIIYAFTPQAFTNAYVKAWNTEEDVYLIIEEINRGNCAQIFGDLFQLLDRKNGFSEYPVDADTDLADYLSNALAQSPRTDFPDGVKEGKKLVLPSNLYIWATMNTSDQSLFPIDSAFKRRWDWVYIPIKNHEDKNYVIDIDGSRYNWWGFLEKINAVIGDTTSSEDKKLGYFFVKADEGIIKEDKFVSKVLFYLWNDVFKNYGFDNAIFSRGDNIKFAFSDFFQNDGSPATSVVNEFLVKLDTTINKEKSFVDEASDGAPSSFMVKYNGEDIEGISARGKYIDLMKRIVSDMGGEQVSKCIGAHLTKEPDFSSTRKFIPVDSEWYLVTNAGIDLMKGNVKKLKESLGIDVVVE